MPTPNEAYAGYSFTINNHQFYAGLFSANNPSFPDIYYPSLLHKEGTAWVEVKKRDPMWIDQQTDFDPVFMANLIVNDFNTVIQSISGGTATLTWNQKLAKVFQEHLAVVDNKLKVTVTQI